MNARLPQNRQNFIKLVRGHSGTSSIHSQTLSAAAGPGLPGALRTACRALFWLTLAFVAFVTLSPIGLRPETPFGADAERFLAFALVSGLAALAYPSRRLSVLAAVVVLAIVLEAAQNIVGGRHGRIQDAEVKICGAFGGAVLALAFERLATLRRA